MEKSLWDYIFLLLREIQNSFTLWIWSKYIENMIEDGEWEVSQKL